MTERRSIEQRELDKPDLIVPCTMVAVNPSCSRYCDEEVVPVHLRIGDASGIGDLVVRVWLSKGHPSPDTCAVMLRHQLGQFGITPQFGIDGSWLELWTSRWSTRFDPRATIEAATESVVLPKVNIGSPDW